MARPIMSIGRPYLEQTEDRSRLCSQISLDGKPVYTVWYEVESKYAPYLCAERADGLVVNLLLYAMEHGYDLASECEMSEKLHYQLTEYLIPSISSNIQKYKAIRIAAPLAEKPIRSAGAAGASLSCGVDSFYTLFRHSNRQESGFEITHLCLFNAGHSGGRGGDKARLRHLNKTAWVRSVADELGKELLCVDTNINEFLEQNHRATHTFRTLAIVLVLQKLFSRYFFASSASFNEFGFSDIAASLYDLLTTKCISTESLEFYVSGGEVTRLEKVRYISRESITYSKLTVCLKKDTNCCKCEKCRRTMLELYSVGALEKYRQVFDVDDFYANKRKYYARMLAFRKDRSLGPNLRNDWQDIYLALRQELTVFDRAYGILWRGYRAYRKGLGFIKKGRAGLRRAKAQG